jgi:CheY-like chemotaxis protein
MMEALAKDREFFDVIIMEYQLPEMNGIEIAKVIHRNRIDARIILITTSASVEGEAIEAGLPFLLKPFSVHELNRSIQSVNA